MTSLATDSATAAPSAPTAPTPAPSPPASPRPVRSRRDRPTSAPSSPTQHNGHGPSRLLLAVIVLVVLGAIGYWLVSTRTIPWPVTTTTGPLVVSGTLETDEVLVGSEVPGRIVSLVREGQQVQAGQVVVQLDDSLIQLQIRQVDTPAQQQLVLQAEKYQLRTPISGVVTRVPLHTGEVVGAGQVVLAVADLSDLEMTAYVLEKDLGRVVVGQEVAVSADPFPGRAFYGVVTSTNQKAEFTPRNVQTQRDRLNLVFGVKIRVDNPRGELKPGMPADATFPPG